MKKYCVVAILAGLLLSAGCSEMGPASDPVVTGSAAGEVRVYEVFGMDCPGCQSAVEKLVNKVPGVQGSQANWKDKRIAVTFEEGSQTTDEDVYAAIRRANFTVGKRLQ